MRYNEIKRGMLVTSRSNLISTMGKIKDKDIVRPGTQLKVVRREGSFGAFKVLILPVDPDNGETFSSAFASEIQPI